MKDILFIISSKMIHILNLFETYRPMLSRIEASLKTFVHFLFVWYNHSIYEIHVIFYLNLS